MKFHQVVILAIAGACPALCQAPKLEPLPIVLPQPLFEGTPEPTNVPNLEKPRGRPRPPFLTPPGVTNVAANKPVTSTDSEPLIGSVDMITDGKKSGSDGTFVELKPGVQSVVIDLGSKHAIYAVLFWHYLKEARAYADVVVDVADDPDFVSNVQILFNNDLENNAGFGIGKDRRYIETAEGKLVDAKGVEARYVRLSSNGSDKTQSNHYVEVEVYGKPVK